MFWQVRGQIGVITVTGSLGLNIWPNLYKTVLNSCVVCRLRTRCQVQQLLLPTKLWTLFEVMCFCLWMEGLYHEHLLPIALNNRSGKWEWQYTSQHVGIWKGVWGRPLKREHETTAAIGPCTDSVRMIMMVKWSIKTVSIMMYFAMSRKWLYNA